MGAFCLGQVVTCWQHWYSCTMGLSNLLSTSWIDCSLSSKMLSSCALIGRISTSRKCLGIEAEQFHRMRRGTLFLVPLQCLESSTTQHSSSYDTVLYCKGENFTGWKFVNLLSGNFCGVKIVVWNMVEVTWSCHIITAYCWNDCWRWGTYRNDFTSTNLSKTCFGATAIPKAVDSTANHRRYW